MKRTNRKNMIASIVKEGRLARGFTQQEVANKTNISLRSIQRIEAGEVEPRAYTLKVLARFLEIPEDTLLTASPAPDQQKTRMSASLRGILSVGVSLLMILLYAAFTAQSGFPETHFEAALGLAGLAGVISLLLMRIWPGRRLPILSIGFMLIAVLLAFAFVAQSPSFPETGFEALLYMAGIVAFSTAVLFWIWRKKHTEDHL
jgi:DNA-binding XRE family transcriptional regulator